MERINMSRSGYTDDGDFDNWAMIRWRGAVTKAINGKRGQAFLKEMLACPDAMLVKKLVHGELETKDGAVCALGSIGKSRGIDMSSIDPHDRDTVAATFQDH
jgi:hypothetical protein